MRAWLAALAMLAALPAAAAETPPLKRGVNLSHWLQYGGGQSVGPEDMALLKREGFDHVRLPVDPANLGWSADQPGMIPQAERLRQSLDMAVAAGLDVILDLHPSEAFKRRLEADPGLEPALARLWQELVWESAHIPPHRIAYELLNEPQYYGRLTGHWGEVQANLARIVRDAAPGRLLLLSGAMGGSVEGLTKLTPLPLPDVAYVVHFYLPYVFTHQGAEWMAADPYTAAASVTGLAWPARMAEPVTGKAAAEVARYRQEDWNFHRIRAELSVAARWGRLHQARVICTEFGVLRAHAEPGSRYGWLGDTRRAFDELGMGWTVWDYADVFGIAGGVPRRLDPPARKALGLVP